MEEGITTLQNPDIEKIDDSRKKVVELVRRWGDDSADAIFDPHTKIFSVPSIDGLIGYRVESGNAIAFGDPVCPPDQKQELALAFKEFCKNEKLDPSFILVSEEFKNWAVQHICPISLTVVDRLYLDPQVSPANKKGERGRLVRRKLKKAASEGVYVKEYIPYDQDLEQEILEVGEAWLRAHPVRRLHIANVTLFNDRFGKRYFYAEHLGQVVGVVVVCQMQARNGWMMNHLMLTKNAPIGVSELLVNSVLEIVAREGCRFVSLGPTAAMKIQEITGLSGWMKMTIQVVYKYAMMTFNFERLQEYWGKFQPDVEPAYLVFTKINLAFIKSLIKILR
jgi:lysylphosphatidylglycerol synthetase-like protein (DUF2156 family)